MKKGLFLAVLFFSASPLLFLSCNSKNQEKTPQSTVVRKTLPSIVIAPVIDSTNFDISWSLSEELTTLLTQQLEKGRKFSLPSSENAETDLSFSQNPFGTDLSWIKKSFRSQEFVVFMELVQHELKTVKKNKQFQGPLNLDMALRIRVVDLRGKKPTIVLQELIQNSYFIAQTLADVDYNQTAWGSMQYKTTPLYHAHLELLEEAYKRIVAYIHR